MQPMLSKLSGVALLSAALGVGQAQADEFTDEELARWQQQHMSVVEKGRELWVSETLGTNRLVCAQCHPLLKSPLPQWERVGERDQEGRGAERLPRVGAFTATAGRQCARGCCSGGIRRIAPDLPRRVVE
jgi:hypothetical protein